MAGRKRPRFEVPEEDINEDDDESKDDDDEHDGGTEDHGTASTPFASANMSALNATSTAYMYCRPPGMDPDYPNSFSGLISIPNSSAIAADATTITPCEAISASSAINATSSSSTTSTTPSAPESEVDSEPELEQNSSQSRGPLASPTVPKASAHRTLARILTMISQHLSGNSSSPTGLLVVETFVDTPSAANPRQTCLTTLVGSGSSSGTTFFTTPSVTWAVPSRANAFGSDRHDSICASANGEGEAQRQQKEQQQDLPQELPLNMIFQVEQKSDQTRQTVPQEIEVQPVFRIQSESSASLPSSSSSQPPTNVRSRYSKRQRVNMREIV
ncbi:hypothetical protein BG015_005081 [Linnemannia schmuckeri]|uniref:Uncharacterized protein n=1 Tax=Linnemannia schmuckeri TaxID=64567 RepID=A0A9P5VC84_9FUNG|nr:hypothetical protein BG015_005081 [Linnemannia schmuckeri]